MQFKFMALCTGLVLASAVPVMAQDTPIYNMNSGTSYYATQQGGSAPIYNNGTNVPPRALNQMIAGKNAPSYSYGGASGNSAYRNFNSNPMANVTSIGSLTPEQGNYLRAQEAREEQERLNQQRQQQQGNYSSAYQGSSFSQLYTNANPFGTKADTEIVTKKRVVYKEANNPLITPPRLFNPEQ